MNWERAKKFVEGMGILSRGGFDPRGPYAQACLETGWFEHSYGSGLNFWGLKKFKGWNGAIFTVQSNEEIKGKMIPITSVFCNPANIGEAMRMYSKFVANRFKPSWDARADAKNYLTLLSSGKYGAWATDSHYLESLLKILDFVSVRGEHIELLEPRMLEYLEVINAKTGKL